MPRTVEDHTPGRPAYFWWLLANGLALCFAIISWTLCLDVFGNPEIPRNYEILRKLGRIPQLKHFSVLDVPNGNLLDPKGLYNKFFALTGEPLQRTNSQLVKNYLTNFPQPKALTFIEGDYQVEQVRVLGKLDFLSDGFAIRARALVKPDDFTKPAPYPVLIEYVFPTKDTGAAREFRPGDILSVKKSPNCAAIVHCDKVQEGGDLLVCLTVIPIAYGAYRVGDTLTFAIEPPAQVQPGAGFPVFKP
ncbi:MAG: hypothetical protein RLZZ282_805 [Verrucomicrobiota bacterium]|jgi:hypothetical protein